MAKGLALSPDGGYLAYSVTTGKSVETIMVVPTSGGTPREITRLNQLGNVFLAWTKDGRFLLFTKQNKDVYELWRAAINGKQAKSLGLAMTGIKHLNVRPDGKQIAFTGQEGHQEIWVMENFPTEAGIKGAASAETAIEESGMRLRKVADVERTVYPQQLGLLGQISPDGRYLSFVDWETGDLAVFDVGTGQTRRLTNKGSWKDSSSYAEGSVWSRDGRQIAYFWDASSPELCTINADGSNSRVVLRDTNLVWIDLYDWSPDGSSILTVLHKKDRTFAIALISIADGSTRQIVEPSLSNWRDFPRNMRFSPDGKRIAYDLRADVNAKGHDIFVHSIADGKHVPLVTHPADDYVLAGPVMAGESFCQLPDRYLRSLGHPR